MEVRFVTKTQCTVKSRIVARSTIKKLNFLGNKYHKMGDDTKRYLICYVI